MHRKEKCFQALHARVELLEQRQTRMDDEQIERILRKILSERFSDSQTVPPNGTRNGLFVLNKPGDEPLAPNPVSIDAADLAVNPDSVPSRAYGEAFHMLETELHKFPSLNGTYPS